MILFKEKFHFQYNWYYFFQPSTTHESRYFKKNKYKKTICKFCEKLIISKHFVRHLGRKHFKEAEVYTLLNLEPKSSQRKKLIALIRNEGNLSTSYNWKIIPKKLDKASGIVSQKDYAICIHCKAYFKKSSLSRHVRNCFANETAAVGRSRALSDSLVYTACRTKYGQILDKLQIKKEIFSKMRADILTKTATQDILIMFYGEEMLNQTTSKKTMYHISNNLRECSKFLLEIKKLGPYSDMLSVLKPEHFDDCIEATKSMSRYDVHTRSFGAASLALHFGRTLKKLSDVAMQLVVKEKIPYLTINKEKMFTDLECFNEIVETRWPIEIGNLASNDLYSKAATTPKLLPITEDIMILKNFVDELSEKSYKELTENPERNVETYLVLVESTIVSMILHNRHRVIDIQSIRLDSYKEQFRDDMTSTCKSTMLSCLSEKERLLTKNYKRIISSGKRNKSITILIPPYLQNYFDLLADIRMDSSWFPTQNPYFFAYPELLKQIDGSAVLRRYTQLSNIKHPDFITSSRIRKYIATVTQILSLKETEIEQLAKFFSQTSAKYEEFYK